MDSKDKYLLNYSDNLTLDNLEEISVNLMLEENQYDEEGSISGVVIDVDGAPIDDATVKIFDLNYNPIKHTMTNEEGKYLISDIPVDDYLVYAVKDGYLLSTKRSISVTNTEMVLGDITLLVDDTYLKGSIYGIVFNSLGKTISEAKVTLRENTEEETLITETISATDGEYVFMNLDAGSYKITATSDDFALIDAIVIDVEAESRVDQDLYLIMLNDNKEGTINGVIYDSVTKTPIASAFVGLYKIDEATSKETLVNTTITNFEGKYFFGAVKEGKYIVKSKAK